MGVQSVTLSVSMIAKEEDENKENNLSCSSSSSVSSAGTPSKRIVSVTNHLAGAKAPAMVVAPVVVEEEDAPARVVAAPVVASVEEEVAKERVNSNNDHTGTEVPVVVEVTDEDDESKENLEHPSNKAPMPVVVEEEAPLERPTSIQTPPPSQGHQKDVLGVYTSHLACKTPVVGEERRRINDMVQDATLESLELVDCVEAPRQDVEESEL